MDLVTFTLGGYRRFVDPTSLKLHSDLIALVGPNEAGKSSILRALQHLNSDGAFDSTETPRRSTTTPLLKWQFQLDDDDKEALQSVPDASNTERVEITKGADGIRRWSFFPRVERDRKPRLLVLKQAKKHAKALQRAVDDFGLELQVDALLETLESVADYDAGILGELQAHIENLNQYFSNVPGGEWDTNLESAIKTLTTQIAELIDTEQLPHPGRLARGVLEPRVPQIRIFDVEDRDLKKEYDLNEEADAPSRALAHLADLAALDLVALRDEIARGAVADASTRRNAANRQLRAAFESWNQEAIALQVDFQGPLLHVQVTTPADDGLSSIDERSEGMRWFATLLAFTSGAGDKPILLADEIETHLHYDAQADLVEVLSGQDLVSKVIYTTHSFGCLPNDLGNGIRVVEQVDVGTSTTKNGFWDRGSGFSPLLVSMGAAAVTFTPTRKAVIGEGATEAILLPTILRQASGISKLSFQIAPGLSSVAAAEVPALGAEAGQVAYLVDGDPGGLKIARKLAPYVPSERIVILEDPANGGPLETEDLVAADIYASAVDDEIHLWNNLSSHFIATDLPQTMRTKAVESWCKRKRTQPPDKAAVAQRIANASGEKDIFEPGRKQFIKDLHSKLESALEPVATPEGQS